jgi:hypothetical protein
MGRGHGGWVGIKVGREFALIKCYPHITFGIDMFCGGYRDTGNHRVVLTTAVIGIGLEYGCEKCARVGITEWASHITFRVDMFRSSNYVACDHRVRLTRYSLK